MADQSQIDALLASAQGIQSKVSDLQSKQTSTQDPNFTQLADQLKAQSGIISSSEQDVTKLIKDAQQTIKTGAEQGAAATTSQYNRAIQDQTQQNQATISTAQEAQRGFATNSALLTQIREQGTKALNDLEQRKQELINSGNAQAAQQIAGLQVQEAQFMVQNRQQVFSNLVALAGVSSQQGQLDLSRQQLQLQKQQAETDLSSKIGTIALQYGVTYKPGDSLQSIVEKASGNSKSIFNLQLQDAAASLKLKGAQTALANAQAAAAQNKTISATDMNSFFNGLKLIGGPTSDVGKSLVGAFTGAFKNPQDFTNFANALGQAQKPTSWSKTDLAQRAVYYKSNGVSFDSAVGNITNDSSISNKEDAIEIVRLYYNQPELPGIMGLYLQDLYQTYGRDIVSAPFNPLGSASHASGKLREGASTIYSSAKNFSGSF